MAKPATHTTKTPEQLKQENGGATDGFVDISQWDFEAFWKPEPGGTVQGTLVDARAIRDRRTRRPKLIYIVQLSAPAKGMSDKEPVDMVAGQVIALGESYALRCLRPVYERQHHAKVRIRAEHKKEIGDQTMWVLKVAVKPGVQRRTPMRVEALLSAGAIPEVQGADPDTDETESDEPFPF